jgi:predicted lipid-binding transport protein (Tim44 family)
MGILLIAAIIFGAVLLFRLIRGGANRTAREPLRYAGATPYGGQPTPVPASPPIGGSAAPHSVAAALGGAQPAAAPASATLLADFDSEQFLQHARTNFVNLQAAHDRKDLTALRDFLTPALYREIEADIRASGDAPQKTEIVTLNGEVLDVTSEDGVYVVSVRFSGLIRDEPGAEAQPFSEVWHLEKPVSGRSGWLVSGIQQA